MFSPTSEKTSTTHLEKKLTTLCQNIADMEILVLYIIFWDIPDYNAADDQQLLMVHP
jgi:hypothetical protein